MTAATKAIQEAVVTIEVVAAPEEEVRGSSEGKGTGTTVDIEPS